MSGGFFDVGEDAVPAEAKKNQDYEKKKQKMFTPVTLKLFMEAKVDSEDNFNVDGQEINDIILVGRVYEKDDQPTRTSFVLNDNTGSMKVTFYKGGSILPKYLEEFKFEEGCYVKIFGQAKNFKEVRQIIGVHLERLEDFNYITNHLLQVFISSCVRKKGVLSNQEITEANVQKGDMSEADKLQLIKTTVINAIKESALRGTPSVKKDVLYKAMKGQVTFPEFEKQLKKLTDDMEIYEDEAGTYGNI